MLDQPLLGLATTEDLLKELLARAEVQYTGGDQVVLRATSDALLKSLSRPALDYRTTEPSGPKEHYRSAEEAISGLGEAEFQLRALNYQNLLSQPELPAYLARDVAKGRQTLRRIAGAVAATVDDLDLGPSGKVPSDLRDRLLRVKDALHG